MSIDFSQTDYTDLVDKTFIGFKLNIPDGNLSIETINDDVTPIVLPQEGIINQEDYSLWIWTNDTIKFDWGNTGHLLMEIK